MSEFIATCDFSNSDIGSVKKGQKLKDCPRVRDLCTAGYVREYKTKVIHQEPVKPTRKKKAKK